MATKETKDRIIEGAIELYNSRGFRDVTMDDIATTLHISKRTIYEIFSTKDELILACLTQVHKTIYLMRKEMYKRSKEPFLMMLYIITKVTSDNLHYSRILTEAKEYYPTFNAQLVRSYSSQFKDSLRAKFDEASKRGDLREGADIEIALDLIAIYIMKGIHNVIDIEAEDKVYSKLCESFFTYLRGLLSIKAIKRYDNNEEKFRKIFES